MARLRRDTQLELRVALQALHRIKTFNGVICEACAYNGIEHPECESSMNSWQTAVTALDKISKIQEGDYNEHELHKS